MNETNNVIKKGPFSWIKNGFHILGQSYKLGGVKTILSTFLFGMGSILRKQFLKGFALLVSEAALLAYLICFGFQYLAKLATLGTSATVKVEVIPGVFTTEYGDNSFFILLFGILSIFVVILFLFLMSVSITANYKEEMLLRDGKKLPTNRQAFASLFDQHFDKTLLAIPVTGIMIFTVIPIIFMICVAFTNYNSRNLPPEKLFQWVGFDNFAQLFDFTKGLGSTFTSVLGWTLVWAIFATFLNYILGIAVAMLINKKGIKLKKMWRTILVITIAVPQFVSLLYMHSLFADDGLVNGLLMQLGWIKDEIHFWSDPFLTKVLIVVINLWIGIPYLMLISTGILMNIPEDLYESARIDGANAWQSFVHITMPYMLFVTGPYLLTSFIGNLNNFNVIYLLSQGKPLGNGLQQNAGNSDLLITWLFKMTSDDSNYAMAAVLGIMVFVVVAVISLAVYRVLPSVKDEEGFQ